MTNTIHEEKERLYIGESDQTDAELIFEEKNKEMIITHTIVDPALQGKGLASKLVEYAVSYAREHGLKIKPVCSFAQQYLTDNPDYEDVVKR